jgi:hypothetical protein
MDFASAIETDPQGRIVLLGGASGRTARRPGRVDGPAFARYLDAPGVADADADGVLDPRDACPERFGDERDGCYVFKPRKIPFRYQPAINDFRGSVYYAPAYRCSRGVKIKVFSKRPGPDRLIGRSEPARNSKGKWEVSALAPPGAYYARAVPRRVPEVGYCAAGVSTTLKRP